MDKLKNLGWEKLKVIDIPDNLYDFINKNGGQFERVYLTGYKDNKLEFAWADRATYTRLIYGLLFIACLSIPMLSLIIVLYIFKQKDEIKTGIPREFIDGVKEVFGCILNKRIYRIYLYVNNEDERNMLTAIVNKDKNADEVVKNFIQKYTKDDEDAEL